MKRAKTLLCGLIFLLLACDHGLEPASGVEGTVVFSGRKLLYDLVGYNVTTLIVVAIDFEREELLANSDPFELVNFDSITNVDTTIVDSASFDYYMILAPDTYKPIINIPQFWVVGLTIPLDHFIAKYRPDNTDEDTEIEEGDVVFWASYSPKVRVEEYEFLSNINFEVDFASLPPKQPGQ